MLAGAISHGMELQRLIEWDEKRVPARPRKKWVSGLFSVLCAICAILLFILHEAMPFPYPGTAIVLLILAVFFYALGIVAYKKEEARVADINSRCRQCGKSMEECVVDMQKSQLDRAVLSRAGLLHRFTAKDKLLEGPDGRVYMTGRKSYAPGLGYAAWKPTGFLLKAKWLACPDCQRSFIQDTVFEVIAKGDAEVKALLKGKKEIG